MKRNRLGYHRFLDGEKLFKLYFEEFGTARSVAKLVSYCKTEGTKNPHTGRPPTRMGVWKAMWAWALMPENLTIARQIFNNGLALSGEYYSDDEWKEFCTSKAKGGVELGKDRYREFEEAMK